MLEPNLPQTPRKARAGFSLVELLVALVFMALLMAGMAKVYQSSMNTFYKSSESISSGRRNRMAMDLLYDDLNAAGQYLVNLTAYPSFSAANPGFYILPNQAYAGTDVPVAKAFTDQLTFYYDEALPFEGRLYDPTAASGVGTFATTSNSDLVSSQADVAKLDTTMYVKFQDPTYASMVETYYKNSLANNSVGLVAVFKDQWGPMAIQDAAAAGSLVTFKAMAAPDNEKGLPTGLNPLNKERHFAGDGSFPSGLPPTINGTPSTSGAPVLFVHPAQMVRYTIKSMDLDPSKSGVGVPCLVRQQGDYSPAGFVSSQETVIAEDVTGFKVYLSAYPDPTNADLAKTWAGWKLTANDFDSGWTNGILAAVNTQLASLGLTASSNTSDPNWFRNTPLLVRVDLTTRTAIKRAENTATGLTADYQERTQTLYMVPRHFGLSFN